MKEFQDEKFLHLCLTKHHTYTDNIHINAVHMYTVFMLSIFTKQIYEVYFSNH